MKTLGTLLIALLVGGWIVAIAILSIQNVFILDESGTAQLVSLKFLNARSIEMPFGLALALCLGLGIIGTAILIPIWQALGTQPSQDNFEDEF
jgi:hypothetical protein